MNIDERIKSISPYFKGLNIVNDATFVLTVFPNTWKVFDSETIKEQFNVFVKREKEGYFFLTETRNGVECLFDAIDYVIKENKAFEEKSALLEVKAKELSDLFVSESIEKLRTLKFVFETKKTSRKPKNDIKKETKPSPDEDIESKTENTCDVKDEKDNSSTPVSTEKKEKKVDISDTMNFIKELTEKSGGKKK